MNLNEDEQHLRLLSIFHYVVALISGLFACFPIFHFGVGVSMLIGSITNPEEMGPMALFGLIFTVIAGSIMFFGWVFAICIALGGRYLTLKKNYMFCLVMGCIECIFTPFGTVLGVFTIIVLMRPTVKELFATNATASVEKSTISPVG